MIFFKLKSAIIFAILCSVKKLSMLRIKVLALFSFVIFSFTCANGQDLLTQQKQERLFKSGVDLMAKNQFGAARENFETYLSTSNTADLKRVDAEYYLASCALNLFHTDAEKLFSDFIVKHPTHPKAATANYDLGNFYYTEKNYKKASTFYNKVDFASLGAEQQNIGRFRAGYSAFNQKALTESLNHFNYIKTQGGQYGPAASYYAGFIEYSQGEYENSLTDLQRAEKNEAYSKIVPYMIANVYYKQKKYDDLQDYITSIKSRTDVANATDIALLSAEAYYKKGDNKSAVTAYSTYLDGKEDTADKGVLLRAGYSAMVLGQDATATKYLKLSFTDRDSVGFYSAYYLGSLYLKQNQKPMALSAFGVSRLYVPDPTLVEESTFQHAKISYDLGQSDQAIAEFEKLIKDFPKSAHANETKELLSQAYVNANNFNKAIEYIEALTTRSVAVERAYQKATMLKGLDLFNKEDYTQANQFFEKSFQYPVDQDYVAEASLWNGEAYSIGKKYEQASAQYLKIVGLVGYSNKETMAKARYGLGYCYFNQQQYDKALFNFKEFVNTSVKGQANLGDGVLRLADCYYVSKSYADALVNYRKSIALNTSDADYAYLQSGVVLSAMSKSTEAAVEFDKVIKIYPQSRIIDEAVYQRSQLYFEQGNYAAAVAGYTKLITTYPTSHFAPYAYTRRAASNFNLKDYTKTSDDYIKVLTDYPNHPAGKDVLLPLQESLNLAGRSAEFDKYLAGYKNANPDAKDIESVEFEVAKNLYLNQDYAKAIQRLASYVSQYPQSPRITEASYYQAESYYRTKEISKALTIYYTISTDKTFASANKVTGRIGELEFKQGKYDKAIPQFMQLARIASNKKEQYTAWNGLMESHFLLAQYDSAKAYAEIILDRGNVNAGATNKASLYLGKIAKERGDYEAAKDELLSTLNAAQDEYGAEAKYLLGEIFYLNKEYKQCYETLVTIPTDFSSYTEWVGKSYLLLSDNYLAMGDSFNAKASLKSLIQNFPLENIKKAAKEKLSKIDETELKRLEKVKAADTLDNEK
jgi:TolA-binding protein